MLHVAAAKLTIGINSMASNQNNDWLISLQEEADKLNLSEAQQILLTQKAKSLLDEWVALDLTWEAGFQEHAKQGDSEKQALAEALLPQFGAAYRETFNSSEAWDDVCAWVGLNKGDVAIGIEVNESAKSPVILDLNYQGKVPSLSETVPVIQNLGIQLHEELPFEFQAGDQEFGLSHIGANADAKTIQNLSKDETQTQFVALLKEVFANRVENDGFNALVATADITWRNSVMIRAIAKFLKQAVLPFSQSYMESCLVRHPQAVTLLCDVFFARLHPEQANDVTADAAIAALGQYCNDVNVEDDRIINAFLTVILATVRTNFWQVTEAGEYRPTISFKIESGLIDFLPQPRPLFEIWVYSPRVEGTHLRGAKVARGGLRWSDRQEDFRTEVLGLVKAQMVKNSVIVPNGSKGGFVCKQLPVNDRAAFNAEGIACYQLFIDSLLCLTDNLQADGSIVPPAATFRRDADDPYLVVAADKGTAKFSDTANKLAEEHGFWLDDAFASGGSVGYDHKGMGITARGAWESVKRHFRDLGKDIQNEDFTVVAIGDMGGDVFGNGMLLSKHIRLQAAFNHMHIFLDPNPDAATSFVERQRLFDGVMGWGEYNRDLISQGGGVFDKSAKHIELSAEVKQFLGVSVDTLTPNELIQAILMSEAELVYNGGIGTYIKSSQESHADAKDKANDAVRVNGMDLRCKVLGEGGNLGATQLGRIEYFQSGGRCCTDAIDNSAGVDCSDHEVNIKILLGSVVAKGQMSLPERNELLKSMTNDVAQLVLRNNYLQTQVLNMNQLKPFEYLPAHAELISFLCETVGLSRALEYLPTKTEIAQRTEREVGLTSPEVAVLMAYSKMHLQDALLASDIPDDVNFQSILIHYFPKALQEKYADEIKNHYLNREIIANQLANRMVNRMGISFVQRFMTESDADVATIARAYWLASEVFNAEEWFTRIEALDNQIPNHIQMELMSQVARLVSRIARGLLHRPELLQDLSNSIAAYKVGVQHILSLMSQYISADKHEYVAEQEALLADFTAIGEAERTYLARLPYAEHVLAMIDLAAKEGLDLESVVEKYFVVADALQMDWMYKAIAALPRTNKWQNQASLAVREDVQQMLLAVVAKCINTDGIGEELKEQAQRQVREMQQYHGCDLAMISALVRSLSRTLLV